MKMTYGLLWFDPSPKRAAGDKILAAAQRYREKFGEEPNLCFVHPDEVPAESPMVTLPSKSVRPAHFLIGIDEDAPRRRSPRLPVPNAAAKRRSRA